MKSKFNHLIHCSIVIILYTASGVLATEDKIKAKANLRKQILFSASNSGFATTTCGCAKTIPKCCTPEYFKFSCDCAQLPTCNSPCPNQSIANLNTANNIIGLHDSMMKNAMFDANNQADLANKAKLQVSTNINQ